MPRLLMLLVLIKQEILLVNIYLLLHQLVKEVVICDKKLHIMTQLYIFVVFLAFGLGI